MQLLTRLVYDPETKEVTVPLWAFPEYSEGDHLIMEQQPDGSILIRRPTEAEKPLFDTVRDVLSKVKD